MKHKILTEAQNTKDKYIYDCVKIGGGKCNLYTAKCMQEFNIGASFCIDFDMKYVFFFGF